MVSTFKHRPEPMHKYTEYLYCSLNSHSFSVERNDPVFCYTNDDTSRKHCDTRVAFAYMPTPSRRFSPLWYPSISPSDTQHSMMGT